LVAFEDPSVPGSAEIRARDELAEWWPGDMDDFRALADELWFDAWEELTRARVAEVVPRFDRERGGEQ
jgi:hypothetical protein